MISQKITGNNSSAIHKSSKDSVSPIFNPLLEGEGADSPDEDEKDEQDIMDNRDEKDDLLTGDTDLFCNIRIKHMQLISRTWIIASILV